MTAKARRATADDLFPGARLEARDARLRGRVVVVEGPGRGDNVVVRHPDGALRSIARSRIYADGVRRDHGYLLLPAEAARRAA